MWTHLLNGWICWTSLSRILALFPKQFYTGPSLFEQSNYKQHVQYAKHDTTPTLQSDAVKFIQWVTGRFLFYAHAIDNTMLHILNNIATATINGTEATLQVTKHFFNYAACNTNAEIICQASDMILQIHSDVAYLVAPEAHSRAGGYHFLWSADFIQFNGPILVIVCIIQNVIASVAEAEIGGLYMNAREAISIQTCLINLDHPQPPSPLTIDNSTAQGIIWGTMKQKKR